MSINLMSAIFRTEFRDLQDADGNTTKASTAKFICIALADHANDEGEGAYPSIGKIAYKTSLSRTAIINGLDALKFNGVLTPVGISKHDTINYTVNPNCFSQDSQPAILVNRVDSPSQPGILPPVNPVDPNHTLTIPKPSSATVEKKSKNKYRDPLWDLQHGETPSEEGQELARRSEIYTDIANRLSAGLRRGEFPQSNDAQKVYKWIADREAEGQGLDGWIAWATEGRRAEFTFIYHKDPNAIKRDWLQIYPPERGAIAKPDSDGGYN